MIAKKLAAFVSGIAVVLSASLVPAHAADPLDSITVQLNAPIGVPVLAEAIGEGKNVLAKPGNAPSQTLELPRGDYTLNAPAVLWAGKRYTLTTPELTKISKDATSVELTWALAEGVQDVEVTTLSDTEVSLAWTGGQGNIQVRRQEGEIAPTSTDQGVSVTVGNGVASDSGLTPGTTYAYTLFQDGQAAYSLILGTSDENAEMSMAFVRDYASTFLAATPAWEALNDNLVVQWPVDLRLPLLGAGVVVPVSDDLPGGFVGTVASISPDGSQVELVAGGYSDALAFLNLESRDYPVVEDTPNPTPDKPKDRDPEDHGGSETIFPTPRKKPTKLPNTGSNPILSCFEPGGEVSVDFQPEVKPVAHFNHKLDKYKWMFPTEIQIDTYVALTATGRADVAVKASGTCAPEALKKVTKSFLIAGVPTMLVFEPTAEVKVEGNYTAQNVGVTATTGFDAKLRIGADGNHLDVKRINESTSLTPTHSGGGSLTVKLGGSLTFGPGVGNSNVGAVAGISGEVALLKAEAKFTVAAPEKGLKACATVGASAEAALKLTAKAWFTFLNAEASWELLKGSVALGGPWSFPAGCETPDVSNDVLGDGVSKDTAETTGSSEQWGRVEGFVPGQETWVLSTGRIKDAVGSPSSVASTELNLPGDPELSAYAGHPTHDAVSYKVTVIPTGSTLKVRYAFASEEYPEYVGSIFNDVMQISVNGKNCAFVPGTNTPVSVNTINAMSNAQYFIDNQGGQAGYGTSMDGITVPLTCSVPVTPGQKATVVIKLADTSDGVLDSAIALLDRGIWSE